MLLYLGYVFLSCLLAHTMCYDYEYFTLYYNKDRPLTIPHVNTINFSPGTDTFVIHQPVEIGEGAVSLEVLVTDSHFTHSEYYHYAKTMTEDWFSVAGVPVAKSFLSQDSCHLFNIAPITVNACSVTKSHRSRLKTIKYSENILRIDLDEWEAKPFAYVYILVVVNYDTAPKSNIQRIWASRFMFNLVMELNIPILKDSVTNTRTSYGIIANIVHIETNVTSSRGDYLTLIGLEMRRACFRDGNRIMTNESQEYEVLIEHEKNDHFLQVTVLLKVKSVIQGSYECILDILDHKRKKLFELHTNKMVCCSNEGSFVSIEKYLSLIESAKTEQYLDMEDQFDTTITSLWSYVRSEISQKYDKIMTLINIVQIIKLLIYPTSIVWILFGLTLFTWKQISQRIESSRRENLVLLETLKQLDPKPKPSAMLKYDVFISYSSHDKEFIDDIILEGLESRGYKCCYDPRNFVPGTSIIKNIAEGIFDSHKTLTVFSKDFLKSRWCTELEFALTYFRIIGDSGAADSLVVLEYKCCKIDKSLQEKNFIRFSDFEDKEMFMDALAKTLGPPRIKPLEITL